MQSPLISVVIPNYNQGLYLESCLESVFKQSYSNYEVILMDGGSSDNSRRILGKHMNRFAYIKQEKDGGQYAAINEGFSKAKGDIFYWLNSDDMVHPGAFLSMAEYIQKYPNNQIFTGLPCIWDESDRLTTVRKESPHWSKEYFLSIDPIRDHYMQQESTFFTRAIWQEVGGIDAKYDLAGDFDLWLRMSKYSEIVRVPRLIGGFRIHGNQRSTTNFNKYILQVQESIADFKRAESEHSHTKEHTYIKTFPKSHFKQDPVHNAIRLVTSISPKNISAQIDTIKTWTDNGFAVTSVNSEQETEQLIDSFPDIEFVRAERTLVSELGKPYVPLSELMKPLSQAESIGGIINSDIKFIHRIGLESVVRDKILSSNTNHSLYLGSRLDITDPLKQVSTENAEKGIAAITTGSQYIFGFDLFLATEHVWKLLLDNLSCSSACLQYALGVPWWDYFLPMRADSMNISLNIFFPPLISHDWHQANYSKKVWSEYGKIYIETEFQGKEEEGKLDEQQMPSDQLLENIAAQTIRHIQIKSTQVSLRNYSMQLHSSTLDTISGNARSQMPISTSHRFNIRQN
ncbi:MAG: glycosyltransferase family 2 protein [Cyanobacteriota bacterium]|jgi:glycosyltransferase involved in cell wall biosynthesis